MYTFYLLMTLVLTPHPFFTNNDCDNGAFRNATLIENIDTIKYLREVVAKKEQYIGKELNVLMKDLSIQPLFFLYNFGGSDNNLDHSKSTSLYFYFYKFDVSKERLASHTHAGLLTIRWQMPMNIDSVISYSRKNGRHWNKAAEEFYGKQIIKDIELH